MNVIKTAIPGVVVFEPRIFGDERGYFFESFRRDVFERFAGGGDLVQDNESKSHYGVLRGLHFQRSPHTQGKLVRVVSGVVMDVAVDLRKGSPWFGKHVSVRLDSELKHMLWVPRGFAHGFVVLSDEAVFSYKCDNYYAPDAEGGIRWNDPALGIDWGLDASVIEVSEKDASLPLLADVEPLAGGGRFAR